MQLCTPCSCVALAAEHPMQLCSSCSCAAHAVVQLMQLCSSCAAHIAVQPMQLCSLIQLHDSPKVPDNGNQNNAIHTNLKNVLAVCTEVNLKISRNYGSRTEIFDTRLGTIPQDEHANAVLYEKIQTSCLLNFNLQKSDQLTGYKKIPAILHTH